MVMKEEMKEEMAEAQYCHSKKSFLPFYSSNTAEDLNTTLSLLSCSVHAVERGLEEVQLHENTRSQF
jgi:hypothetical protein